MLVNINKRNYSVYALDVESHNDDESIRLGETGIWLGCLLNDESKVSDPDSYFYTMEELFTKLEDLSAEHHREKGDHRRVKNLLIYVYNLSFEYSFILPYLLSNGWTWEESILDDDEKTFNAVTNKTAASVWQIRLHYSKTHGEIVFRDMSKIYHGGLRQVAASFNLETQKGEIDYTLNRRHNYQVTWEEKIYCYNDTHILVEILQILINRKDKLFFKSLSASTLAVENMIRYTGNSKPYTEFRRLYPKLIGAEAEFVRHTIAGGITYATPTYQFKTLLDPVGHIDANQMHPSSAYLNTYPYGTGTYGKGKPPFSKGKIYAVHMQISYNGVKLHSVINLIGIDAIDDYDLYAWSFEIPTMEKCYEHLKIKYIDYYEYNTRPLPWREFYQHNWTERMKSIEEGDEFGKYHYKLLNNSSYGKLIENPHLYSLENYINEDGQIDSIKTPKELKEDDYGLYGAKFTYIPVGSCIPAYSRVCLIETALTIGWQYITYFDTDSIFFIWNDETKSRMESAVKMNRVLGGWKLEEILVKSQFAVPKRYKAETDQGIDYIKAAGFNFKDKLYFDDVNLTDSHWNVKRTYRVKGGTIVADQVKELGVPKKYLAIYHNNINEDEEAEL